jgi:hypothetical protein
VEISSWTNNVDSDETMKRGDEAFNALSLLFSEALNASLLQLFWWHLMHRPVTILKVGSLFHASSPLLFKRDTSLNAALPLFFKATLPTSVCQYTSKQVKILLSL